MNDNILLKKLNGNIIFIFYRNKEMKIIRYFYEIKIVSDFLNFDCYLILSMGVLFLNVICFIVY